MKNYIIKALLLAMVAIMTIGTAGCGGDAAESKTGGSSSPAEETTVSKEFLDSLKGMNIKIAYPDKMRNPGQTPMDDEWQVMVNQVAKELGVTITEEFLTNKQNGAAFITESLAGNNSGNIEVVWLSNVFNGVQKNAWAKLDDAAKEIGVDFSSDWYFKPNMQAGNIDNGQYGLSYKTQFVDYPAIYYNVNMVTVDNKLEDPFDLYKKGQWTFDKFEEYCKKLTKTDASGTISIYGCQLPASASITNFVAANGGAIGRISSDGTWKQTLAESATVNALNYIYKWMYSDKCLYIPTGTWGTSFQNLYDGKTAMAVGSSACAADSYLKQVDEGGMGVVPLPVGPDAGENDSLYSTGGFVYVIPAAYQKEAAKYLYVLNEVSKRWYKNYENVYRAQFTAIFKDTKYYDYFYKLVNNDLLKSINGGSLMLAGDETGYSGTMLAVAITNGASPATAIDQFASAMQNANDDIMGSTRYTGFKN